MAAIKEKDYKALWGRAGGACSNPDCGKDLTLDLFQSGTISIGEMAHVIAKSSSGPRGIKGKQDNSYSNLILLCPTCHKTVDKAEKDYPDALLLSWKANQEEKISKSRKVKKFSDNKALCGFVTKKLGENHRLWRDLGPKSDLALLDPNSNLSEIWIKARYDVIGVNNKEIIEAIESSMDILSDNQASAFWKFKVHAFAYAEHLARPLDSYPLFPIEFAEVFNVE